MWTINNDLTTDLIKFNGEAIISGKEIAFKILADRSASCFELDLEDDDLIININVTTSNHFKVKKIRVTKDLKMSIDITSERFDVDETKSKSHSYDLMFPQDLTEYICR